MPYPFLKEMIDSAVCLVPDRERWYFYAIGAGQEHLVRAVLTRSGGAVPVLVGTSPEELVRIRDRIPDVGAMGYVEDVFREEWFSGLPTAPGLIGIAYRLSAVSDRKKADFLRSACSRLREDGMLLWGDLFLPQSLETHSVYQEAEAVWRTAVEPDLSLEQALRRVGVEQSGLAPCLLDRAREMLYDAGFANVEIPWKRYGHTVIAAMK